MNLDKLVGIIPDLFLYIIPGYIAIIIKQNSRHQKIDNQNNIILLSIVISFIIINILNLIVMLLNLVPMINIDLDRYENVRTILVLVLSLLYGAIWVKYKDSHLEKKIKKFLDDESIDKPSVWASTMEYKKGAWIIVYLYENDIAYTGKLLDYTLDPEAKIREISLTSYTSTVISSKETIESYDNDDDKIVLINCTDLKNIEIFRSKT